MPDSTAPQRTLESLTSSFHTVCLNYEDAADVAGAEPDRFQDRDVALLFEHDGRNDVVDAERRDDQHGADHRVHDDIARRQRAHDVFAGLLPGHALVAE